MLCEYCKHYLGMTYRGKVRCIKRGTKRPRTLKCVQWAMKEDC